MDLGFETQKTNVGIRISHPQDTMRASFRVKRTTLTFLVKICLKMDFGKRIQKI